MTMTSETVSESTELGMEACSTTMKSDTETMEMSPINMKSDMERGMENQIPI